MKGARKWNVHGTQELCTYMQYSVASQHGRTSRLVVSSTNKNYDIADFQGFGGPARTIGAVFFHSMPCRTWMLSQVWEGLKYVVCCRRVDLGMCNFVVDMSRVWKWWNQQATYEGRQQLLPTNRWPQTATSYEDITTELGTLGTGTIPLPWVVEVSSCVSRSLWVYGLEFSLNSTQMLCASNDDWKKTF